MTRQFFTALIIIALLSGHAWAAKLLSDPELERISGAGIEFSLDGQGIPQQPQQPNQQGTFPPATGPQNHDGMNLFPTTIVVLQSSAEIDHRRVLTLGDDAQQRLRTVSLNNSYASDAVATVNLFGGVLDVPPGIVPLLQIDQGSEVHQLYRQQGQLYSSEAGFRYVTTLRQTYNREQNETSVSSRVEQADRQETYLQTQSLWDVQVAKIQRPDIVLGSGFSQSVPWRHRLIERFEVDASADTWLGSYGGTATYSGLTLTGPYASTHGPYDLGEDLLLGATLRLPTIDFGNVVIEKCAGDCDEVKTIDLARIGGTDLLTVLAAIDKDVAADDFISFSDEAGREGIILHGLGDLLADELNLNSGFVVAGSGHIKTEETARIRIGAEANFALNTELKFTIDLRDIDTLGLIADLFGKEVARWSYSREDQLIDVTIPITFVELETPPFELDFNGLVVAQLGSGEVSADGLESAVVSHRYRDNSRVEDSSHQDAGSSSYVDTFQHSAFVGGRMAEGEAELLAMSEGALAVERGGNIALSGRAQSDMRVLHGVNTVTSLAANGFNVGSLPVLTGGIKQMSLRQQNLFVQQR